MSKPRILFIMHMPPPVHGAAMVGKYIHDSKLVNEVFDCHYINLTTAQSLEDIGKAGLKKGITFLILLWRIIKMVTKIKPKWVYVTPNAFGKPFFKDFIVVQLLKVLGCKVMVHYHNKGVKTCEDKCLYNLCYKVFFHNLKVILLAENLYTDIEKYVERKDVWICPNGIPERQTKIEEKQTTNRPYLLFLSNLLVAKGVLDLLDALCVLKEERAEFIAEFIGAKTHEIDDVRFSREVDNRCLQGQVRYLGKKYGEEKENAFEKADIFILPTHNECFPLVLLEAMQHELPCITTSEGGIPDIIIHGKEGLIVEKENPKDLAQAIKKLIYDPQLRKSMGENGLKKYKENYTLPIFEQNFCSTLKEIITSTRLSKGE